MRIVAGTLKGRSIDAPDGQGTRPTTDRVREALFSSLYSLLGGFDGLRVLDAFAGSGALGIEALSRGARSALFYERDPKAAAVLKRNVKSCGFGPDQATVVQRDVLKNQPTAASAPIDLVFLDPPYAYDASEVLGMIRALLEMGTLAPDACIVYEHALDSKAAVADAAAQCGFEVLASKKYGKTGVTTLSCERSA